MKLKKIASLALAGIMAVSMLAGCGTQNGGSNDDGNTVVTTSVVDALNNGQGAKNEVKVTFTSNSDLDAMLAAAVKDSAPSVAESTLLTRIKAYNGVAAWNKVSKSYSSNFYGADNAKSPIAYTNAGSTEKVNPVTLMQVYKVSSTDAWTEENAVKVAVGKMDEDLATLVADDVVYNESAKKWQVATNASSLDLNSTNKFYHTYAYTGNVSMVSETNGDGTTDYYFVMVITQNVTQVEYEG